ncbi:MAG: hypothetical protein LCH46_07275 [Proteobacteria bacterium]|nr:hypothetical protein [Pseudomonadota bacterium]
MAISNASLKALLRLNEGFARAETSTQMEFDLYMLELRGILITHWSRPKDYARLEARMMAAFDRFLLDRSKKNERAFFATCRKIWEATHRDYVCAEGRALRARADDVSRRVHDVIEHNILPATGLPEGFQSYPGPITMVAA